MNNKYLTIQKLEGKKYVFFNTLTRGIVTIESDSSINSLCDLSEDQVALLKKEMVLLDDEDSVLEFMYNSIKYDNDKLYITDVLSYDCNLSCVYCMQQNTKSSTHSKMSPIQRVGIWKALTDCIHPLEVGINLFGGEPFIDIEYVDQILDIAKEDGINITTITATTNGTIVNSKLIKLLNKHKISNLQITVDGTTKVHDSRRYTKQKKLGTFEKIVHNIGELLNKTDCMIVINTVLDSNNYSVYTEMVDYIVERIDAKYFLSYPRVIFRIGLLCHPDGKSTYTSAGRPNLKNYGRMYMECLNYLYNKNLPISSFTPINTPICTHRRKTDFVISPEGDLYNCVTGVGIEEFLISKNNEITLEPEKFYLSMCKAKEKKVGVEDCKGCKFYPICLGGCVYNCYTENTPNDCMADFNNEIWPDMMRILSNIDFITDNIVRKNND